MRLCPLDCIFIQGLLHSYGSRVLSSLQFFPLNYNHMLIISKYFSLALTLLLCFRLNHMSSEYLQLTVPWAPQRQHVYNLTHGLTPSCIVFMVSQSTQSLKQKLGCSSFLSAPKIFDSPSFCVKNCQCVSFTLKWFYCNFFLIDLLHPVLNPLSSSSALRAYHTPSNETI